MARRKKHDTEEQAEPKRVRRIRHWKQRYDPNATFVWRKPVNWGGERMRVGDELTPDMIEAMGRAKLRRMWESQTIELAEFELQLVPAVDDVVGDLEPELSSEEAFEAPAVDDADGL